MARRLYARRRSNWRSSRGSVPVRGRRRAGKTQDVDAQLAALSGFTSNKAMAAAVRCLVTHSDEERLFRSVAASNRGGASTITVPEKQESRVRKFAADNPVDGAILLRAFDRTPRFHRGGWIMNLQPGAAAMTLDSYVFIPRHDQLSLATYVHELVHVWHYGRLGPLGFLEAYFGVGAEEVLQRMQKREPLNPSDASPLEEAAFALEARFVEWDRTHPDGDTRP